MIKPLMVLVPTRGRPQNAARLEKAFEETESLNIDWRFVVDHDDPELPAYREASSRLAVDEGRSSGDGMVAVLNRAARAYTGLGAYPYLGFMGDDHLPRTPGWDAHVIGALRAPGARVAYGDDLLQGEALPTAAFLPTRLVSALGYMAPPVLRHLYVDNFWLELGRALNGLRYLPDAVIEHVHPAAGKTPMDERYAAVNAPETDAADHAAWLAFRDGGGFAEAVRRARREYGEAGRGALPAA